MTDDTQDPTPLKKCRVQLDTVAAVRREMCRTYRQARGGEMPLVAMTKLIFALAQIGRLLEAETFETRLLALESLPDSTPARLPLPEDMP